MKKLIIIIIIILLGGAGIAQAITYDWILAEPVQTDNTNFDWVLGLPYIIYEVVATTPYQPRPPGIGISGGGFLMFQNYELRTIKNYEQGN